MTQKLWGNDTLSNDRNELICSLYEKIKYFISQSIEKQH